MLPFVNMSADKEQEYFADGISEELLNLLAQVPELRVIARTSSFSFKGKDVDIAEIARRLNVANVLEGSVRKSGDKVRITAQLIRAADSSHLWSQTYDREMTDVFAVQDEIAAAVVSELKMELLGATPKARGNRSEGLCAVPAGSRAWTARHVPRLSRQSIALYQEALTLDPRMRRRGLGWLAPTATRRTSACGPRTRAIAWRARRRKKALALDPNYAPAHAILGWIALSRRGSGRGRAASRARAGPGAGATPTCMAAPLSWLVVSAGWTRRSR